MEVDQQKSWDVTSANLEIWVRQMNMLPRIGQLPTNMGGVYVFKANNSFYSYQKIKTYQRTVGVEPGKHVLWSDRRKIEDLRNRNLGFDQSK